MKKEGHPVAANVEQLLTGKKFGTKTIRIGFRPRAVSILRLRVISQSQVPDGVWSVAAEKNRMAL